MVVALSYFAQKLSAGGCFHLLRSFALMQVSALFSSTRFSQDSWKTFSGVACCHHVFPLENILLFILETSFVVVEKKCQMVLFLFKLLFIICRRRYQGEVMLEWFLTKRRRLVNVIEVGLCIEVLFESFRGWGTICFVRKDIWCKDWGSG